MTIPLQDPLVSSVFDEVTGGQSPSLPPDLLLSTSNRAPPLDTQMPPPFFPFGTDETPFARAGDTPVTTGAPGPTPQNQPEDRFLRPGPEYPRRPHCLAHQYKLTRILFDELRLGDLINTAQDSLIELSKVTAKGIGPRGTQWFKVKYANGQCFDGRLPSGSFFHVLREGSQWREWMATVDELVGPDLESEKRLPITDIYIPAFQEVWPTNTDRQQHEPNVPPINVPSETPPPAEPGTTISTATEEQTNATTGLDGTNESPLPTAVPPRTPEMATPSTDPDATESTTAQEQTNATTGLNSGVGDSAPQPLSQQEQQQQRAADLNKEVEWGCYLRAYVKPEYRLENGWHGDFPED